MSPPRSSRVFPGLSSGSVPSAGRPGASYASPSFSAFQFIFLVTGSRVIGDAGPAIQGAGDAPQASADAAAPIFRTDRELMAGVSAYLAETLLVDY